jgi:hypothetical protein
MSPEQEQQIIDALTNPSLNWMHDDPFAFAHHSISHLCNCSTEDAKGILEQIYLERKLIELASESGGTPAENRTPESYGTKWIRKKN